MAKDSWRRPSQTFGVPSVCSSHLWGPGPNDSSCFICSNSDLCVLSLDGLPWFAGTPAHCTVVRNLSPVSSWTIMRLMWVPFLRNHSLPLLVVQTWRQLPHLSVPVLCLWWQCYFGTIYSIIIRNHYNLYIMKVLFYIYLPWCFLSYITPWHTWGTKHKWNELDKGIYKT